MHFLEWFIIFIIIILVFFYIKGLTAEVLYVKSKVDNNMYLVRKMPNQQEAADLLANIGNKLEELVVYVAATYPENEDVKRLFKNYYKKNISESSPSSQYTSYSVDKGERIVLCIRQKDKLSSFVDMNTILFVAIHELGHLMTDEIGHTPVFWANFKFLLEEAVTIGIYTKVDYAEKPEKYCGIKIQSTVI